MADEREGAEGPRQDPANRQTIQSGGRQQNAAQPLNAANDRGGPERYPAVNQTDAVEPTGREQKASPEHRSFDPSADAPAPRPGGDAAPAATPTGWMGPAGDPAEGKR